MNKRQYSDETRAAVMAALLAGQSVSSVAKEYSIPKGTVSDWNKKANEVRQGVGNEPTQKKTLSSIGDSLLELVATEIQSLIVISKETRDPRWIKMQTASDLAVFVGVKQDKLMRMLEAFGRSGDRDTASGN